MHTQHALDTYLTAVAAATACVDTVHARIASAHTPKIFLTMEGLRRAGQTDVLLTECELTDPGHERTKSAHEALAHKAARQAWKEAKERTAQDLRDAGMLLLRHVMDGPHRPERAVLHTSVGVGLVAAQLCLQRVTAFEPAHALKLGEHQDAFRALVHASQDPLGHPGKPSWLVTAFLHPWKGRSAEDVDCAQRIVAAGTVEQALMATALTGVNAMLAPNRVEDIQIWKSLEGHDAAALHAHLAANRTTSVA